MYSPDRNSLKQHPDDDPSDVREVNTKRQKTSASYYPVAFWNTLSVVRLSRRALKELDRRKEEEGKPGQVYTTAGDRRLLISDVLRIRLIAGRGGCDLSVLRGYAYVTMDQMQIYAADPGPPAIGNIRIVTPYSAEFEQKMIDKGVFPEGHEDAAGDIDEPDNLDELREVLAQARGSLSPTLLHDSTYREFQRGNRRAKSESMAMAAVMPIIAGSRDSKQHSAGNVPLDKLKEFDRYISSAKPDIYYGARPAHIDYRVRRDLGEFIVPSGQKERPAAPNFFFACKGPSGRADVALRQAMYYGALGARGLLHLQSYGNAAIIHDGNAYTMSATYCAGALKIYATHPRESTLAGRTEYHMTLLDGFAMTGNINTCRSGIAAYRNARDWTEKQRNRFIENANRTVQGLSTQSV